MRAVTVEPGTKDSVALTDMPEPPEVDGPVLVETAAIGICGTDLEIVNGEYGTAPPGDDRLVLGHESLGRVVERRPAPTFTSAIWWSVSCAAATRFLVRRALPATGTCAATGATPNEASKPAMGSRPSASGPTPSIW